MWRCVWPLGATYRIQLVPVAANSNSEKENRRRSASGPSPRRPRSSTTDVRIGRRGQRSPSRRVAVAADGVPLFVLTDMDLVEGALRHRRSHWSDARSAERLVSLFLRNAPRHRAATTRLCVARVPASARELAPPLCSPLLASPMGLAFLRYLSLSQRLTHEDLFTCRRSIQWRSGTRLTTAPFRLLDCLISAKIPLIGPAGFFVCRSLRPICHSEVSRTNLRNLFLELRLVLSPCNR